MNEMPFADELVQAARVLKLTSPLGDDVLLPERANIVEGVNRLFELHIAVRSKKDIKPADLIGKSIDLDIEISQGDFNEEPVRRCWNGIVTELEEGPAVTRGLRSYHLIVRPSLWLLTQTRDSRIWMDQTTVNVLDTLLNEHGLKSADTSGLVNPAPATHFSVQFNESDLRYLLRRFEAEGYFWWFSHEKGSHRLNVANHATGWLQPSAAAKGQNEVRLAFGSSDINHIQEWKRRFTYVPGMRTGADWNYKTFGQIPLNTTPSLVELPDNSRREIFEWPARAMDTQEAEAVQRLRIQATEADHERVSGASTVRFLEPGRRFKPYDVANPDAQFEEHVIAAIEHEIIDRSYETNSGSKPEYRNRFEAIPSRVPLTPHRDTPKPRIEGLQVAVVAGPEGEEIHCDSDGCVKLWFPWQRTRAKKDGSDTKWIRVSTNWAGQGWGGSVIPRIGMEVLVAFLDSDPDRPIVTGLVPNPKNSVPYTLPENKTKTSFRTNTHKGTGFNEITFEDENSREEVYIHAEKDMNVEVENSKHEYVGALSGTTTLGFKIDQVGIGRVANVGYGDFEKIGGNKVVSVGVNGFVDFANPIRNRYLSMYQAMQNEPMMSGSGNYILNCTSSISLSALDSVSLFGNSGVIIQSDASLNVSSAGNMVAAAGKQMFIEAEDTLLIRCGKSCIAMDKNGKIVISGGQIEVYGEAGDGAKYIKMKSTKIDLN